MMNSPMIQNLMSNPEVVRALVNSNPALRTVCVSLTGSRGGGDHDWNFRDVFPDHHISCLFTKRD